MCGRFTINYTYEQMLEYLNKEYSIFDFEIDFSLPRFNIAPGQQVLSVIYDGKNYRAGTFKWGFVSSFSTDDKSAYKMINARSEDIENKMSFKDSFFNKRCIILADGFYEWDKHLGTNNPYYFTFEDNKIVAFAGIWSRYIKNGTPIYTCSILTTKANEIVGSIHDRMPVILSGDKAVKWLDIEEKDIINLKELLTQYDSSLMNKREVSRYINKVSNDDSKCIEETDELRLF